MDIEKYEELTGETVDTDDQNRIKAQIRRTKGMLETLLGYSLSKQKASENQYKELGKAKTDCIFRGLITDINNLELDPADEVIGSYRLFPYNKSDKYLEVDPFIKVNKVKLVFLKTAVSDGASNGITHKTFDTGKISESPSGSISKYIQKCEDCWCACECDDCVQLAVDAEWLNEGCLPDQLLDLWADMVTYYSNPKFGVVEETLGTHRYKLDTSAPESTDINLAVLKKYAGPHGSVNQVVTI